MKLKKSTFSVEPDMVTSEGNNKLIAFDVEEVKVKNEAMGEGGEATETTQYAAYCVRVDEPVTRDRIIAAIITARDLATAVTALRLAIFAPRMHISMPFTQ